MKIELMEAGFTDQEIKSQTVWMFQFKSDILAPFSAQKLSNCLATVNDAVPLRLTMSL